MPSSDINLYNSAGHLKPGYAQQISTTNCILMHKQKKRGKKCVLLQKILVKLRYLSRGCSWDKAYITVFKRPANETPCPLAQMVKPRVPRAEAEERWKWCRHTIEELHGLNPDITALQYRTENILETGHSGLTYACVQTSRSSGETLFCSAQKVQRKQNSNRD